MELSVLDREAREAGSAECCRNSQFPIVGGCSSRRTSSRSSAQLGCKKHLKQTNTKKTFAFITPVFFPGRMFFTTQGSPATKHNGSQLVLFSFVFFSLL